MKKFKKENRQYWRLTNVYFYGTARNILRSGLFIPAVILQGGIIIEIIVGIESAGTVVADPQSDRVDILQ